MKNLIIRILLLSLFVIVFHGIAPAQKYSLTVVIEGVHQVRGKMQVGLFNNADDFLETDSEFRVAGVAVDSTATIVAFDSLPAGKYGISLYQDLDTSSKINKNILGIPVEPYGISNNAWHRFSAPRWEEASFVVEADTTIVIHLRH